VGGMSGFENRVFNERQARLFSIGYSEITLRDNFESH
jgi:hypothetical protein